MHGNLHLQQDLHLSNRRGSRRAAQSVDQEGGLQESHQLPGELDANRAWVSKDDGRSFPDEDEIGSL